jgi:hypothetical protein
MGVLATFELIASVMKAINDAFSACDAGMKWEPCA